MAGIFGVEGPVQCNDELHRKGIIARAQAMAQVKLVCCGQRVQVQFNAQARLLRHINVAVLNLQGLLCSGT